MYRHSELEVNKINQWGLVYRWQGSDESLKPLVFAAHLGTAKSSVSFHDIDRI